MIRTADAIDRLAPVTLAELEATAALLTRVDRKYLLAPSRLEDLLDRVEASTGSRVPTRALEIDGDRDFGYRSTYLDTPDLAFYRLAAQSRPRRIKVRTRTYTTTDAEWLEVKARDGRDVTLKDRIELAAGPPTTSWSLSEPARTFLATFPDLGPRIETLAPTLVTTYRRTTLVCGDVEDGQRVTIDRNLRCAAPDQPQTHLGPLSDLLVIETKSPGPRPGPFDQILWQMHNRPVSMSKYGVGLAATYPTLPANKWHRLLKRYVETELTRTP